MKVVFIDDETYLLETIKEIFIDDFPNAHFFSDSVKARNYLLNEEEKTDLVVSDFKMPKVNGLDIVESLRTNGKDFPIIIFSGFFDEVIMEKINLFQDVLICEKPEFAKLRNMISSIL